MALTQITTGGLANGAVTSSKISNTVQLGGPTISQIQITDSSYNVLDDTAVSTSGGYIKITGTGFAAGAIVVIGSVNATSTGFVSSTVLNVQVPALTAGTYTVYVVNTNGGTAIGVNGLTYSGSPTWVTASTLSNGVSGTPISIQLSATGDTPMTYALAAGNTLPTGLSLTSGGLLSGTVTVGIETVYAFTVVATDVQLQDSPRAFTITIIVGDPYFYLTTLLLPGNGTNGGTNNTFTDQSTNNFAITRNGDTTQGTFGPFSQTGWSNYFDGTGDYLTNIGTTSSFNFLHNTTALFTIEAWVYRTSSGGQQTIIDTNAAASASIGCWAAVEANNTLRIFITKGSAGNPVIDASSSGTVPINQWTHIAFTYDQSLANNNVKFYINGVLSGTGNKTANTPVNSNASNAMSIGSYQGGGSYFVGYLSNLRVTNALVYSSNFTPSTTPLAAIANTSLLTCQNNRFIDNSTNNFAITVNGDTSVQSFSPFNPTGSYNSSTMGGSAYFDGDGDFLSLSNNSAFLFGSGDFTIEFYAYTIAGGTAIGIWDDASTTPQAWIMGATSHGSTSTTMRFTIDVSTTDTLVLNSSTNIPINQWTHMAVTRSGSSWYMFFNGQVVATATNGSTISNGNGPLCIGGYSGAGVSNKYSMKGYISGLRILKGTALYTSTFTPPTAPLTNITNTSLLCNFTSAQITDATSKNDLQSVNTAQISTTQSKWGGSSIFFDGTDDFLLVKPTPLLEFGSGNFTIEFWWYPTSTARQALYHGSYGTDWSVGIDYSSTSTNQKIGIWASSNGSSWNLINADPGGNGIGTTTVTQNAWNHIAYVRNGTTWMLFVNGNRDLNLTGISGSIVNRASSQKAIGCWFSTTAIGEASGYFNDFRITNGYARYTANFTPPTSAFLLQ